MQCTPWLLSLSDLKSIAGCPSMVMPIDQSTERHRSRLEITLSFQLLSAAISVDPFQPLSPLQANIDRFLLSPRQLRFVSAY